MAEAEANTPQGDTPFNDLMSRLTEAVKTRDRINVLNPDFVAKIYLAREAQSDNKEAISEQNSLVTQALMDVVPDAKERSYVSSWFISKALEVGFNDAFHLLSFLVRHGGHPSQGMRVVNGRVMLPPDVSIPGLTFGPWLSPSRAKAVRALERLGNPHGLGLTVRDALRRYGQTTQALRPEDKALARATRFVYSALADPSVTVEVHPSGPELLEIDIGYDEEAAFGSKVEAKIDPFLERKAQQAVNSTKVSDTSLTYWAPTLKRLGIAKGESAA